MGWSIGERKLYRQRERREENRRAEMGNEGRDREGRKRETSGDLQRGPFQSLAENGFVYAREEAT